MLRLAQAISAKQRVSIAPVTACRYGAVALPSALRQRRLLSRKVEAQAEPTLSSSPASSTRPSQSTSNNATASTTEHTTSSASKQEQTEQDEKHTATIQAKDKEIATLKDQYLRAVADLRNSQDRAIKDIASAKNFAIQKFAKDLIDSVDNFNRALNTVPASALHEESNKELVDLFNGLKMIEDGLLKTLNRHGLERLDPMNKPFDPSSMEATFQVPHETAEPGSVCHVEQLGFLLNGRVIRPSKVYSPTLDVGEAGKLTSYRWVWSSRQNKCNFVYISSL